MLLKKFNCSYKMSKDIIILLFFINYCYQSFDWRRSAPGAAEPENLEQAGGNASTRWALSVLMAIRSFFLAPNAVIPSSVKLSAVNDENMSMSISLTTKVPARILMF